MTVLITKPGVYDLPAEDYHQDPCPAPSLSSSVAYVLLEQTPRHAAEMHPKLNPNHQPAQAKHMDFGSVAHALMLDDHRSVRVIKSPNYRSVAAQMKRDIAHAAGQIPILADDYARAETMVKAGRMQLAAHAEASLAFLDGRAEVSLIWKEKLGPREFVWCRARLDYLPDRRDASTIYFDYKTVGGSAEPDAFRRAIFTEGYDLQVGFYRRGLRAVFGIPDARFAFVVQEVEPPFALSVIGLDQRAVELADAKADEAIKLWGECLRERCWPGYPTRICYVGPPMWTEERLVGRQMRAETERGLALRERALWWQSPLDRPFKGTKKGKAA